MKKDNIVEWIFDGKGNIKIEIKEIVLRGKKAKVEKIRDEDVKGEEVMKGDENMEVIARKLN